MVDFRSAYEGKTVWLSGHTGFKGSWLAEWLLLLGARVHGYALQPSTEPAMFTDLGLPLRMESQIGDIRNASEVANSIVEVQPDYVFHLAAQPLVRKSYEAPCETYETNVMGAVHVLEGLRRLRKSCAAVFVTTDKCYENREWLHAYREEDALGGHDPYSSSKAACEIAISSWRRSFFGDHPVRVASARAGNVIGGGDWALDRIVPDAIRALRVNAPIPVRNPHATRPWQHVLEPLSGYLTLAAQLAKVRSSDHALCAAFNFGPPLTSNRTVECVVQELLKHTPGTWVDRSDSRAPHEAGKLNLECSKAYHLLGWQPRWDFQTTMAKTTAWYHQARATADVSALTRGQIAEYQQALLS